MKRTDRQYRNFIDQIISQATTIFSTMSEYGAEKVATRDSNLAEFDLLRMSEKQKDEYELEYGRQAVLEEYNRQRAVQIGMVLLVLASASVIVFLLLKQSSKK